jgi:hypothetical protein
MTKQVKAYTLAGFLFTVVAGTLLHFLYQWTNNATAVAFFAPVNESVWEHLKLLVVPMLLFSLFEFIMLGGTYPKILPADAAGLLLGSASIPILFYTYSGIIGRSFLAIDILIFIIASAFAFAASRYFLLKRPLSKKSSIILLVGAFLFIICFFVFTFFQPPIGLFSQP